MSFQPFALVPGSSPKCNVGSPRNNLSVIAASVRLTHLTPPPPNSLAKDGEFCKNQWGDDI